MNVRAVAARTLAHVIGQQRSLATVLPPALQQVAPRDRGLLQEFCHGVCRWQPALQAMLDHLLVRPLAAGESAVQALLLMGLYQLWYLRIPDHAAVAETVTAARQLHKPWAVGLTNGLLRAALRRRTELTALLETDPVAQTAHPAWLLERLRHDWPEDWPHLIAANNTRPPFTVRINALRTDCDTYRQKLLQLGYEATPVSGVATALTLAQPLDVLELPGFTEGWVSVQDAAAQQAAPLLDAQPGMRVLDACAAPGGKTGHLLELIPDLALTALDQDAHRLARVRDTLSRLQLQAQTRVGDARQPALWWEGEQYDRILLDAPCSATGVIRRHPDIKLLRRERDISELAAQQRTLLSGLWPLLRLGGRLLYVTCSVLRQENEQVIAAFLSTHADAAEAPIAASWGHALSHGRQILPGETAMDGFYYAALHKQDSAASV